MKTNKMSNVLLKYHWNRLILLQCKRFFWKCEFNQQSSKGTVATKEVEKFHQLASVYWNKNGPFALLHSMNSVRVPLISDGLKKTGIVSHDFADGPLPLEGLHILDVGCGGGLLSEALASLGASVTGIDATAEMIQVAHDHCSQNPTISNRITYMCNSVEDLNPEQMKYDAVVASEVIEHVDNQNQFIAYCVDLVKENGSLFFTTINKTWVSYLLAIATAEWLLRIVPQGTHDWNQFVPPSQLQNLLENNDCGIRLVHGLCYNPLTRKWSCVSDSSVNYALHAIKYKR